MSDADRAAAVADAAEGVFVAFDVWRSWPGWRDDDIGRQLQHLVDGTRTAVAALPDRPDPAAVVAAVQPLLRVWWPSWPPPYALATAAAVEHLRLAASHPPP